MRKKRKCLLLLLVFSILILSFSVPVFAKTKINKKSATLHVGETVQLKVTGTKSKVKWSSSDKKTANVTKQGLVKAKKAGKTTITAKVGK